MKREFKKPYFCSVNYAIVDIETTGGSVKSSKITEIAIYKHDGHGIIDSFSSLVNPEMPIPDFIVIFTGITNEMVKDAPKFYEIAKKIIEFTDDCIFVAHNVGFDYGIIRHEFKQLGYDFRKPHLCTVRASRIVLPGMESYSLGKLTKALGITLKNRHRAAGDAEATAHLFTQLMNTDKNQLKTFIQEEIDTRLLHPQLDLESIEEIPSKVGVYTLYNENNQVIFIEKSTSLNKSITQHLRKNKTIQEARLQREIARVSYELTGTELIACLRKQELQNTKTALLQAKKKLDFSFSIAAFQTQNNFHQLFTGKRSATTQDIAIYKTLKEANSALSKLTKHYQLCLKLSNPNSDINCDCDACQLRESSDLYNQKVKQAIEVLTLSQKNLLILGNGRSKSEKSLVWIEYGIYQGYGFIPFFALKNKPKYWLKYIEQKQASSETSKLVSYFIQFDDKLQIIEL